MDETTVIVSLTDPLREYTPEEERQLTQNLANLWASIRGGSLSSGPVNHVFIKTVHDAIFGGVRTHAGRYRTSDHLTYGPNRSPHCEQIQRLLDETFAKFEKGLRRLNERAADADYVLEAIDLAVWIHAEIIRVHPFEDGNGRTSRMVLDLALIRLGLDPIPTDVPKEEYNSVLNLYFSTGDMQPLADLYVRLAHANMSQKT